MAKNCNSGNQSRTSWQVLRLATVLMATPAAHSASIASDGFEDYAPGALAGANGGTGWGNAWSALNTANVVNGGLDYSSGSVVVNGGSRSLEVAFPTGEPSISDGLLSRALVTGQSSTVYMSLLFQDTINPNLPDNDFVQWGFDSTGTSNNPRTSIMRRNGTFQSRSTTSAANTNDSGISSVAGQTFLLVFKAEKTGANYDRILLFVNPSSNVEPGSADALATANSGISTLDNFISRSAFHETGDAFRIDAIQIGTTFEDVVTIPEPGSLTFLASASMIMTLRRRRTPSPPQRI